MLRFVFSFFLVEEVLQSMDGEHYGSYLAPGKTFVLFQVACKVGYTR